MLIVINIIYNLKFNSSPVQKNNRLVILNSDEAIEFQINSKNNYNEGLACFYKNVTVCYNV